MTSGCVRVLYSLTPSTFQTWPEKDLDHTGFFFIAQNRVHLLNANDLKVLRSQNSLLCCPSHSFYSTFLNIHLYYSVSFCLLRAFVSAQGSGAPQKRGGFVTKRILKKLNLWGRLVVKTVKKCRNHCKKGWKNCPPHVIASPGFSVSTHNLLTILRSASWYLNLR